MSKQIEECEASFYTFIFGGKTTKNKKERRKRKIQS